MSSLACNPASLGPNSSSTCTVTLTQAAPTGGASVTLTSSTSSLTVPASVTVAAAATTATFNATTAAISSNQTATVTATYNSSSAKTTISLVNMLVSSVTCTPTSLGPNATSTCTVTLNNAALAGGSAVQLSSNRTNLSVPASVTVAAAATTANFSAQSGTIPSSESATVTASLNGGSRSATIRLVAPSLVSVAVTPGNPAIVKGASVQFTATGTYSDGSTQALTNLTWRSGSTKVATIRSSGLATGVAAGSSTIQATSNSISGSTVLTVSASQPQTVTANNAATTQTTTGASTSDPSQGAAPQAASSLKDLYCLPRSAKAGELVSCELRLNGTTAPHLLHLTSSTEAVRIPTSLQARAGQRTVTFQASIDPAAGRQTAAIAVVDGDTQVQDAISVTPGAGPVLKTPGRQMAKPGEALSFGVSAADPDSLPLQLSAMGLPEGASFDASTGRF